MKKILIIILLGIFIPTLVARAFSLSPLRYVFAVERGEVTEVAVVLNNYEIETVVLEPAAVGIRVDEAGRPIFDSASELSAWVKPDWNFVTLKEGGEKKVKFFITVPAGTYPGDYYLGVGARRAVTEKTAVNIGEQLLTVVNLKVAGEARENLVVKKFENSAPFYDNNKKFNLEIASEGNVEMPLGAVLKIIDWRGRIITEQAVSVGNKILPMMSRVARAEFDFAPSDLEEAGGRLAGTALPGLYQADIVIDYGLTKQKITAVEKFWYVPVWAVIAVSGTLIIIVILLLMRLRRRSDPVSQYGAGPRRDDNA